MPHTAGCYYRIHWRLLWQPILNWTIVILCCLPEVSPRCIPTTNVRGISYEVRSTVNVMGHCFVITIGYRECVCAQWQSDTGWNASARITTALGVWKWKPVLTRNDLSGYANGECEKPLVLADDNASRAAYNAFLKKRQADIILSTRFSELKQVKHCSTSCDVWLKSQSICQSSGPDRKGHPV